MTISSLFLPQYYKEKPLLTQTILGISFDHEFVYATVVKAHRNKTTIHTIEKFKIEDGDKKTYHQRVTVALKNVVPLIKKNCIIRIAIPASKVITKELTVPFLDYEKIKMVIDYEVEPAIPFTLEQALIDFIIIKKSEVKESSTVLVAATQKTVIQEYMEMFDRAGIEPSVVTVDLFGLVGLFRQLPKTVVDKKISILLDVQQDSTRMAMLHKEQLLVARTIQHKARKTVEKLVEDISLTLESFQLKQDKPLAIHTVAITGNNKKKEELKTLCSETLGITCTEVEVEKLIKQKGFETKVSLNTLQWRQLAPALGAVLVPYDQRNFTLRQKEFAIPPEKSIKRYIVTAFFLWFTMFFAITSRGYFALSSLEQTIGKFEKKEVKKLKRIFPDELKKKAGKKLAQVVKKAENFVSEQKEIWAPFSKQRLRPLHILQELTILIDRRRFNIDIEQVTISTGESETPTIEVHGFFQSKTGGNHFTHFSELESVIKTSHILLLTEEVDPTMSEEGDGVKFVLRLKQKE